MKVKLLKKIRKRYSIYKRYSREHQSYRFYLDDARSEYCCTDSTEFSECYKYLIYVIRKNYGTHRRSEKVWWNKNNGKNI